MIKRAFVLGAGLGTRLRPLTDQLPKPLVPIFQKPLITFVINTHRLAGEFEQLFAANTYEGHPVALVHEPDLLETGGGMKNAQRWLGAESFIVYSADILTDMNLAPLIEEHFRAGNDVTLALRQTGLAANVAFHDGRVIDIQNRYGYVGNYDYANVSVWSPEIFDRIPSGKKISFIPILAQWIGDQGKIGGVLLSEGQWFNLSSRREYLAIHRMISEQHWRPDYVKTPGWPLRIAVDVRIDPGAQVTGCSSIGLGCRIGAGAVINDSILWPGAQVAARSNLRNCIVRSNRCVEGVLTDVDV
jgi:mannose-1-phosphate guanylyltransferase